MNLLDPQPQMPSLAVALVQNINQAKRPDNNRSPAAPGSRHRGRSALLSRRSSPLAGERSAHCVRNLRK
jgi:hypothetical protein